MDNLLELDCIPLQDKSHCLDNSVIDNLVKQVAGWSINSESALSRRFSFSNFYETVGFINAVAWIANKEDHHPDIKAGYNYCELAFRTHSIDCISINDFICAAKINAL
jgi:4a-hydroxytetrahydrobiopterin dehydratase